MAEQKEISDASPQQAMIASAIGNQIKLPWSKAIEISLKSVKIRFARSMITAGGVVLAITFLMSTLTRGAVIENIKIELPAGIKTARAEITKVRAAFLTAYQAAPPETQKVLNTFKEGKDIERMKQQLDKAIEKDELKEAQVSGLRTHLDALGAVNARYQELERLRIDLIKSGENVPLNRQESTDGIMTDAEKEEAEAKARNLWLVVLAGLVAMVGITNSMLMSVTERFREIGTMKCLGALDWFIVQLFLIESGMQGFLGTLLGVIVGFGLALAKLYYSFDGLTEFLPWGGLGEKVLLAMAIGTGIAVLGALYPSIVAAKMEPVVAMRVDQ